MGIGDWAQSPISNPHVKNKKKNKIIKYIINLINFFNKIINTIIILINNKLLLLFNINKSKAHYIIKNKNKLIKILNMFQLL